MGSLGGILETSWAVLAKFLSRLGPQLGSILDPKMALELPKSRPRGAYRTPKRPLGAKNHPKAAQSPPKPPREVPRPPLSLDFRGSTVAGTRLCRAEDMFEPFLHTPSVVFRPFWKTHSSSWKTHGKPTAPLGKLIFDVCWAWFWMGWWGHAER